MCRHHYYSCYRHKYDKDFPNSSRLIDLKIFSRFYKQNDPCVSSVLLVYTAKKSAMLFLVIELGDVFFSKIARSSYPLEKEVHAYFHFFFHFPPPPKSWCLKKVEIWVDPHWDVGRNKWITKCLVLNYNYNWVFPSLKIIRRSLKSLQGFIFTNKSSPSL